MTLAPALSAKTGIRQSNSQTSGAKQHKERPDRAAVEDAGSRPGQSVTEQHQRIGEIDGHKAGRRAARGQQRETAGIDDMGRAPPHRRANAAVLQPGENQKRAKQRGDEDGDNGEGLQIEMHAAITHR